MGIEWMTVIYQRSDPSAYYVRGSYRRVRSPSLWIDAMLGLTYD